MYIVAFAINWGLRFLTFLFKKAELPIEGEASKALY